MRWRHAATVFGIAAVFSSAGCRGVQLGTTCERPESGALLCVFAGHDAADGRLLTPDTERGGVLGSSCWEVERGLTECGDFGVLPKLEQPLSVERGSTIAVLTDADRLWVAIGTVNTETGSRDFDRVAELLFTDGRATVDVALGRYVVSVFGRWGRQDAELFFPISVS